MTTATSYTILPASLKLTYVKGRNNIGMQNLSYTVREKNGAEFTAVVLWNIEQSKKSWHLPLHKLLSQQQAEMLRQATLQEKRAHGLTLTPAELRSLRYAKRAISRTCTKQPAAAAPKPAAPTITPAAIAETLKALQGQINNQNIVIANLQKQLLQVNCDKERLTKELAATRIQLAKVTEAVKILTSK